MGNLSWFGGQQLTLVISHVFTLTLENRWLELMTVHLHIYKMNSFSFFVLSPKSRYRTNASQPIKEFERNFQVVESSTYPV